MIALVLRFYKGAISYNDICNITITQLYNLMNEISNVIKLEHPDSKDDKKESTPLTGEQGAMLAQRIFKKGNK